MNDKDRELAQEVNEARIDSIVQGYWKDKLKLMEAIEWIGKNDYSLAELISLLEPHKYANDTVIGIRLLSLIQQRFEEMAGEELD